jgi:tetratricopeptide (TPR) repeat protein
VLRWIALALAFSPGLAVAADLTPDAAYALVVRAPLARDPLPTPQQVAAARKVLEAQAVREPKSARWAYALAHAARAEAEQAEGDTAEAKRKEAQERFEDAAELQPGHADNQVWLANAIFDRIDDVGMLSKMSMAGKGREAFEKAIALDSNNVGGRVGLARFFLGAPSIAGGSAEKAKAKGNELLALPGKRGEFQGHMVLAGVAANQSAWAEMTRHFTAAETAQGVGADPLTALRSHVSSLLNGKEDPQAAVPVMVRYVKAAPADDMTALFFDGEVKRQTGKCAEALPRYDQVMVKVEGARGSRWGAAVCHDQLGHKDAARKNYQEFVRRFPDDPRAKQGRAALERLGGS